MQRELDRSLETKFNSSAESSDNSGPGDFFGNGVVPKIAGFDLLARVAMKSISKEIGRTVLPASKSKIQSLTADGKGKLIRRPQVSETITLGPMTPQ